MKKLQTTNCKQSYITPQVICTAISQPQAVLARFSLSTLDIEEYEDGEDL